MNGSAKPPQNVILFKRWIGPGSAQLSFTRNGMDVLKNKKVYTKKRKKRKYKKLKI